MEFDFNNYIVSGYLATYGVTIETHYNTISVLDFYNNINHITGTYAKVREYRNEFLNEKPTEYNEEIREIGKKLCTPRMLEELKTRIKEKTSARADLIINNSNENYLKFLQERREKNG